MDLVTLFLSCSFVSLDDDLLLSVAQRESQASAFYVRAEGRPDGIDYKDADRALDAISRLAKKADEVYVGLMGVPISAAVDYNLTAMQLIAPCDNVKIATAMLSDYRKHCEAESVSDTTSCTLSAYGDATGFHGDHFAEEIIFGALANGNDETAESDAEKISDDVLFEKESKQPGSDSLFFEVDFENLSKHSGSKVAEDLDD